MKIFQALKLKKQLAGELNTLSERIQMNNSTIKGNGFDYNVNDLLSELEEKQEKMIRLKVALQETNKPIYYKIFKLGELKSLIYCLSNTPTKSGTRYDKYNDGLVVEYVCVLPQKEIDGMIKKYQKEIATIQDEIDEFNYKTSIEI